ncbi:thiol:disulfide interchange protein [Pandoraea horticolens]|uniref:Thiol:disulfide interchange protein DsbD n=1 Tax=Pandoraea horticolens TaxID=2508298 RepID=A0A5E4VXV7_9BURK|nr:protein-disulfide reductase DsbD [Pandoraea horticolens]VVE16104.1 thiol:disulfide interchange protein [Pandoraea horticolens]
MLRRFFYIFVILLGALGGMRAADAFPWQSEPKFLDASQVLTLSPVTEVDGHLEVVGSVAKDYYVYRHSLRAEDASGQPIDLTLSEGAKHTDEFFGDTEIYTRDALRIRLPPATPGPVTLYWQGCAEAGICYPPQTMQVTLPAGSTSVANAPAVSAVPPAASVDASPDASATPLAEDQAAAQRLATVGPVAATLLFFGFGLLLAFTPCTLPMIPIVSTMIVGNRPAPLRALALSLSYVLAMALTYAAVGVAAGLAGANLQAALQSPWLLGAFAGLFLVLAASLFGLFELRLPAFVTNRLDATGHQRTGGSLAGAAALGFLSALLVGPCMTAPLAGALLYIGQTGNAWTGGIALFALGLGMGLPLLVIAVFGSRVLPRPGPWMVRVRIAFAYVMTGMAVLMLSRFLPGNVSLLLWGTLGLGLAVGFAAWAWTLRGKPPGWTLMFASAFAGVWSVFMLVGAASGSDSVLRPLERAAPAIVSSADARSAKTFEYVSVKSTEDVDARIAQATAKGQWTLIDFYADWCVSCHVIERNVFGDPAVAARLARMQVLRPDVTKNDKIDQALMKHWGVLGPPTLILIDANGKEVRAQRSVGELDARSFLQRLDTAGMV